MVAYPTPDLPRATPGHYIVPRPPFGLRLLAARTARRYARLSDSFYRRCELRSTANANRAATVLAAAAQAAHRARARYEQALCPEFLFPATDCFPRL